MGEPKMDGLRSTIKNVELGHYVRLHFDSMRLSLIAGTAVSGLKQQISDFIKKLEPIALGRLDTISINRLVCIGLFAQSGPLLKEKFSSLQELSRRFTIILDAQSDIETLLQLKFSGTNKPLDQPRARVLSICGDHETAINFPNKIGSVNVSLIKSMNKEIFETFYGIRDDTPFIGEKNLLESIDGLVEEISRQIDAHDANALVCYDNFDTLIPAVFASKCLKLPLYVVKQPQSYNPFDFGSALLQDFYPHRASALHDAPLLPDNHAYNRSPPEIQSFETTNQEKNIKSNIALPTNAWHVTSATTLTPSERIVYFIETENYSSGQVCLSVYNKNTKQFTSPILKYNELSHDRDGKKGLIFELDAGNYEILAYYAAKDTAREFVWKIFDLRAPEGPIASLKSTNKQENKAILIRSSIGLCSGIEVYYNGEHSISAQINYRLIRGLKFPNSVANLPLSHNYHGRASDITLSPGWNIIEFTPPTKCNLGIEISSDSFDKDDIVKFAVLANETAPRRFKIDKEFSSRAAILCLKDSIDTDLQKLLKAFDGSAIIITDSISHLLSNLPNLGGNRDIEILSIRPEIVSGKSLLEILKCVDDDLEGLSSIFVCGTKLKNSINQNRFYGRVRDLKEFRSGINDCNTNMGSIVIASPDFRFSTWLEADLANKGTKIFRNYWSGHQRTTIAASAKSWHKAEIVFCDWCLGNAVWWSNNLAKSQRLIIRFHAHERLSDFPYQVNYDNVEKIVFVSPRIMREAIEKFRIPPEKCIYIANAPPMRSLGNHTNEVDKRQILIGMVGITPWLKRPDLALKIARILHQEFNIKLIVRGELPSNHKWLGSRNAEVRNYLSINEKMLLAIKEGYLGFEEYSSDIGEFYQRIGWILSLSDHEGCHTVIAESGQTGVVPLILNWPGADEIYPEYLVHKSLDEICEFFSENFNSYSELSNNVKSEFAKRFDPKEIFKQWLEIFFDDSAPKYIKIDNIDFDFRAELGMALRAIQILLKKRRNEDANTSYDELCNFTNFHPTVARRYSKFLLNIKNYEKALIVAQKGLVNKENDQSLIKYCQTAEAKLNGIEPKSEIYYRDKIISLRRNKQSTYRRVLRYLDYLIKNGKLLPETIGSVMIGTGIGPQWFSQYDKECKDKEEWQSLRIQAYLDVFEFEKAIERLEQAPIGKINLPIYRTAQLDAYKKLKAQSKKRDIDLIIEFVKKNSGKLAHLVNRDGDDNIGIFISALKIGGSEKRACRLVSTLIENGFKAKLLVGSQKAKEFQPPNIPIAFADDTKLAENCRVAISGNEIIKDLRDILLANELDKLAYFFSSSDLKIAHVQMGLDYEAIILSELLNLKFVLQFGAMPNTQNSIILSDRELARMKLMKSLMQNDFNFIEYATNSKAAVKAWAQYAQIPEKKIALISNGLEISKEGHSATDIRGELQIPKDAPIIGASMRLALIKNPDLWFETALEIYKQRPDAHFIIIGDGPLRKYFETLFRNAKMIGNVHFCGMVTQNIDKFYNSIDVLLLTSFSESMPNALIEGLSHGCVCVTPNIGGIAEIGEFADALRILDSHNPVEFAEACLDFISSLELRVKLRASLPNKIRGKFSNMKMLKDALAAYGEN